MPPVPNVIFARPRTTQFWPTSDALLVAEDAGDGRCSGKRAGFAAHTDRIDHLGQHRPGDAERVEHVVVPVRPVDAPQRRS